MSIICAETLDNKNTLFLSVVDHSYKIMEWSSDQQKYLYIISLPKHFTRSMAELEFNTFFESTNEELYV